MGELEQPCDEKKFDIFYDILHLIVLKKKGQEIAHFSFDRKVK